MELKTVVCRYKGLSSRLIKNLYLKSAYICYSNCMDSYLDNLVIQEGSKKEMSLLKYFESSSNNLGLLSTMTHLIPSLKRLNDVPRTDLISHIELEMKEEESIPNRKLYIILTYFVKHGDINGVKAIQFVVEKNNISHFKLYSQYKHYLAEALWISGKIQDSLELFLFAYNNVLIRPQVIVMLNCLFPLLISQHSEVLLHKTVHSIEQFSVERNDFIILSYVWKELFQSDWFSEQQLSKEIVKRNPKMFKLIYFMIPNMGKVLLREHNVNAFYRLLEFTLENKLNQDGILIQLLFDYYYIHQNIERCSAVVKYANTKSGSSLTDDQQRRYLNLLLKSKNASFSRLNIKKPQHLKYKF